MTTMVTSATMESRAQATFDDAVEFLKVFFEYYA
jgi:hypothetical protein